jgi:hypothetical protein
MKKIYNKKKEMHVPKLETPLNLNPESIIYVILLWIKLLSFPVFTSDHWLIGKTKDILYVYALVESQTRTEHITEMCKDEKTDNLPIASGTPPVHENMWSSAVGSSSNAFPIPLTCLLTQS